MVTEINASTSGTKDMTVRATNFNVAHYCHEDQLLRANSINDSEILLREISNGHVLSLVLAIGVYGFNYN